MAKSMKLTKRKTMKKGKKVCDIDIITKEALKIMQASEWRLREYLTNDESAMLLMMVYVSYGSVAKFRYDFHNSIQITVDDSVISIRRSGHLMTNRISGNLCRYDDLTQDLTKIVWEFDKAITRWEENFDNR